MRCIQYLLIFLTAFLSPSHMETAVPAAHRVVTRIDVTVIHESQSTTATYTGNQMESILTYLRLTEPAATVHFEPDSFRADSYTFTFYFSDGTRSVYRQIYHDYLQKDGGRWQRIAPKADLLFPPL